MATRYEWVTLFFTNWKTVVAIIALLAGGNGFGWWGNFKKEARIQELTAPVTVNIEPMTADSLPAHEHPVPAHTHPPKHIQADRDHEARHHQ